MKIIPITPPREFEVGFPEHRQTLKDCAHIELDPDEQVTLKTDEGNEFDIVKKDWGFYATPSLNSRLLKYNLHAALCKNRIDNYFILLVEDGKQETFLEYLNLEKMEIIMWLDSRDNLKNLESKNL
ncbi:MAG: hypothetical protein JXQ82_09135 [Methanomicrobiaceae archaeon]|nr:hypothetical protein [Methanomicrobiaceae archaeon]